MRGRGIRQKYILDIFCRILAITMQPPQNNNGSQKMAAFSSHPALGARDSGTMLVYVTSGVDQISKFSWRGALRTMIQMCLELAVLTSFKMAWGGVEGRRKVPEVLLFGDLKGIGV